MQRRTEVFRLLYYYFFLRPLSHAGIEEKAAAAAAVCIWLAGSLASCLPSYTGLWPSWFMERASLPDMYVRTYVRTKAALI